VLSIVNVEVCGKSCVMSSDQFLILIAFANGCSTVQDIIEAINIKKDMLTVLQRQNSVAPELDI
jgi:hypothetical protein